MARTKKSEPVVPERDIRVPLSPEAKEEQMIGLAVSLAEQQLRDGTASSQVITHFLKLGTEKYRKEIEKLEEDNKLLRAKTEALESAKKTEELFTEAIAAFRSYQPTQDDEEVDDGYY